MNVLFILTCRDQIDEDTEKHTCVVEALHDAQGQINKGDEGGLSPSQIHKREARAKLRMMLDNEEDSSKEEEGSTRSKENGDEEESQLSCENASDACARNSACDALAREACALSLRITQGRRVQFELDVIKEGFRRCMMHIEKCSIRCFSIIYLFYVLFLLLYCYTFMLLFSFTLTSDIYVAEDTQEIMQELGPLILSLCRLSSHFGILSIQEEKKKRRNKRKREK